MGRHDATIDRILSDKPEPTVALNPLTGLHWDDIRDIGRRTSVQGLRQPLLLSKHLAAHARKLLSILAGKQAYSVAHGDRRFQDEQWQSSPVYQRILQSYLAMNESLSAWAEELELNDVDRLRTDFLLRLITDSLAPTNTLPGNPAAMRRLRDSRGGSIADGLCNLVRDLRHNHGMPAQVKTEPFKLGVNIATTAGSVVFRNDVLELIQYHPTTEQVHRRPLLFVSAMINKFYALDLSDRNSMIKYALDQGQQVFVVSWANPQPDQAHWGIAHYAMAVVEALSAIKAITGSRTVNLFALCSGGMAMSAMAAWLKKHNDASIHSMTIGVCMLEMRNTDTEMSAFANEEIYERVKKRSAKAGVLWGHELALSMLWLRPQDLIWNNVVNNYLMGQDPPEFDLLYWNNDWTNLPAALHADVTDMFATGSLLTPGQMHLDGEPLDLQSVRCDKFFVAGLSDHITPWKACYRSASHYSGNCEFLLSNSGHMQTLLNSPHKKNASYFTGKGMPAEADDWLEASEWVEGSWWAHWQQWIEPRSGARKTAPTRTGNKHYPPLCDAPGDYAMQPSERH